MKLLEGKVAIVTGAARGIGEAVAIKFAEHGANIAFTYVSDGSKEKAAALEAKLQSMGVKAKAYQSNAGDFAACESFVTDVLKEFGTVDICVNNAGISMRALFKDLDLVVIRNLMDVNFWGTVYCTKYALPYLLQSKGSVVGVSSIAGVKGLPGRTGYSSRGTLSTIGRIRVWMASISK